MGGDGLVRPASEEADEGDNHDQRAGRGLAQRQAIHHLGGSQPVEVFDAALVDVGQYGVGAAESHQGRLGEEPAHLRQDPVDTEQPRQQQPAASHQRDAGGAYACQSSPTEAGVGRGGGVIVDQGGGVGGLHLGRAVGAAQRKQLGAQAAADPAQQGSGADDGGEGEFNETDGNEGGKRNGHQMAVAQSAGADAPGRGQDDGDHGGLHAVEDAGDGGHAAISHIGPGQADQQDERGQDEKHAGDDAAQGAVHHPADVNGELRGFGAGQQHAVIEGVQEAVFRDPSPAFHQFGMHHGDLARRATEADETELEPVQEGFAQWDVKKGSAWLPFFVSNWLVSHSLSFQPAPAARWRPEAAACARVARGSVGR